MKKRVFSVFIAAMLAAALYGCGDKVTPDTNKPESKPTTYTNKEEGYAITLPAGWTVVDKAAMEDEAVAKQVEEKLSVKKEDYLLSLDYVDFMAYAFEESTNGFTPNINLVLTQAPGGKTQAELSASVADLEAELLAQYSQAPFSDYSKLMDSEAVTLGDNQFVCFYPKYTIGDVSVEAMQAMTIHDGKCLIFTFSGGPDSLNASQGSYKQILETLKLS